MRIELAAIIAVAAIISTHMAGLSGRLKSQDKQLTSHNTQAVSTQSAKTKYSQNEVILKSDGTWEFKHKVLNYRRRNLYPWKTLIPKGYVGWINIHYGVEYAPPLTIEDGFIILKVPPNGELKTSSFTGYFHGSDEMDRAKRSEAEVYEYSGDSLTPFAPIDTPKRKGRGGDTSPSTIRENVRTILRIGRMPSDESDGSYPESYHFFVGTAQQWHEYGEDRTTGSKVPLAPEVENHWNDSAVNSSTITFLTPEDTQMGFTKSGRAITLVTDANNYRTWKYAEADPIVLSDSVLNAELYQAIEEAIKLLEASEYEAFYRRFWNPYLRNAGYEDPRPKNKSTDIVEALINLTGSREGFDKMSQEMCPKLLESLHKIQNSQPVYSKIEYSENIKASFFEDGEKNSDLKGNLASVPFVRVGQTWYIFFR
jgi:hypothetical protein